MLLSIQSIEPDNYVAFTFFIGYIAMLAASVYFFVERNSVDPKWRMSLLVSGLITGIAAVHYYYMRDYNLVTGDSPTFFRYVDWILTVPLMCVEFYLLTKLAGAKKSLMETIFANMDVSLWIYGEAFNPEGGSTSHSVVGSLINFRISLHTSFCLVR